MSPVPKHLLADEKPPFCQLLIKDHFEALSEKEKLYAHYISRASFYGTRIVLRQTSPESEPLYDFILAIFTHLKHDISKLASEAGISDDAAQQYIDYASQVLGNLGNFKSFGDRKFVPRLDAADFAKIANLTPETEKIWGSIKDVIYCVEPTPCTLLGYPDDGHISTYYPDSPGITKEEIASVQEVLVANNVLLENTRLRRLDSGDFELLTASADKTGDAKEYKCKSGKSVKVIYGDYSAEMAKIAESLDKAREHALNQNEEAMMEEYVKSFKTGSLEAHKESQRHWIKDIGPKVESDLGFIESYRDPSGVRAEWEGFVAMVNQERTRVFGELVDKASKFIPLLPWGKEFEKDVFKKPDFTSLEVLSFCTSGIPAGINIPNYDDIRQTLGFKNVSLGNILNAKSPSDKLTFIEEKDVALYEKLRGPSFELQVGLHELLGHGSGKLLQETEKGKFNFDKENPPQSPVDNKPIKHNYGVGETWGGCFGPIAASYEECRAECVAMSLSTNEEILAVFGHTKESEQKADDVLYISWLQMARAGLLSLEQWDPHSKKWGQAHSQARFAILRAFLQAGDDFVTLHSTKDDFSDLVVKLDRSKIESHGKPAVDAFLQKLHVFKSTADVGAGTKLYHEMTNVGDMAKYRPIIMDKRLPRKQFVQANTVIEGGKVVLKEYEASAAGMMQSYVERDV